MATKAAYDGEVISGIDTADYNNPFYYQRLYAKHPREVNFYARSLADDGLIVGEFGESGIEFTAYRLKFAGLDYVAQLKEDAGIMQRWGLPTD